MRYYQIWQRDGMTIYLHEGEQRVRIDMGSAPPHDGAYHPVCDACPQCLAVFKMVVLEAEKILNVPRSTLDLENKRLCVDGVDC